MTPDDEDDLLAALQAMEDGGVARSFDGVPASPSPSSVSATPTGHEPLATSTPGHEQVDTSSLTPFAGIWSAAKALDPSADATLTATLDSVTSPIPDTDLDSLLEPTLPAAPTAPADSSRVLLLYTALGAFCAALGRWIALDASASGSPIDHLGTLLLASVVGAFTALGIGLADHAGLTLPARRLAYTTFSGAIVGTLGSFCLIVPMFHVRSVFLRLIVFSAAIALVDLIAKRGTAQIALLSVAGLAAGWVTSVSPLIDPYSPAPWAMAATFGLMGLSVGMARRMQIPA